MAPNFVCMASANQSQYAAYKVIFIIMGAFALCFMLLVMCTRVPELKTSDITKIENVVSEVCYCIENANHLQYRKLFLKNNIHFSYVQNYLIKSCFLQAVDILVHSVKCHQ